MTVRSVWVLCCVLAGLPGLAATFPNNPATGKADDFFGTTNLYTFHLTIAPDQWAIMEQLDEYKPSAVRPPRNGNEPGRPWNAPRAWGRNLLGLGVAGMRAMMGLDFKKGAANLEFNGQPFGPIRVRFKGNSSFSYARNSLKRSFKLDFNDLDKDRRFFGMTKLNLNNNALDPSQLREALAYEVFREAGLAASRTAFARVYVTVPGKYEKSYAGLYTIVEQVDERFLKHRFGAKEGLLLKPDHLPGLPFLGTNWDAYTNRIGAKSEPTAEESSRFIELVKWLNLSDQEQFQAGASNFIDADEYLRFLAVEVLLSNLDSPLTTGHNYYLYLHPKTQKFHWIPWDLNLAFGGFLLAGTAGEQIDLSLDQPYTRVNRLAERLLQTPGMKQRYHEILRGLLATNFNTARLVPVLEGMAAAIRPALTNDPMISLPQFEAAISETNRPASMASETAGIFNFRRGALGRRLGPKPAIKAFIIQRAESAQLQLDGQTNGYVPRDLRPFRPAVDPP